MDKQVSVKFSESSGSLQQIDEEDKENKSQNADSSSIKTSVKSSEVEDLSISISFESSQSS